MPRYDMKCSICGFEAEVTRSITETMPQGCLNPEYSCPGIMEVQFKSAPYIHPNALPSKSGNDNVRYTSEPVTP